MSTWPRSHRGSCLSLYAAIIRILSIPCLTPELSRVCRGRRSGRDMDDSGIQRLHLDCVHPKIRALGNLDPARQRDPGVVQRMMVGGI